MRSGNMTGGGCLRRGCCAVHVAAKAKHHHAVRPLQTRRRKTDPATDLNPPPLLTVRRLSSPMIERERTVRRGDPLPQVATRTLEEGHEFEFANTRMLARAGNKTGRELLKAWVSDTNSINRHIDLPRVITRSAHAANWYSSHRRKVQMASPRRGTIVEHKPDLPTSLADTEEEEEKKEEEEKEEEEETSDEGKLCC
nr:unnamed protein product [Spirometra erinaceieuropaei]